MSLPKSPAVKDQLVLCHLGEGRIQSAPGGWGQNDILERAARRDRLNTTATTDAEQAREGDWGHFVYLISMHVQANLRWGVAIRAPNGNKKLQWQASSLLIGISQSAADMLESIDSLHPEERHVRTADLP
jgi:hypothetical protein